MQHLDLDVMHGAAAVCSPEQQQEQCLCSLHVIIAGKICVPF